MKKNIILGVTASIASYKVCDIISLLRKDGFSVRCVMSAHAKWFITPLTLETLTNKKVVQDMFSLPENRNPVHVSLADEADLILVAPVTADMIGKIAAGICDEVLTCAICASDCPVVFAPAMNDKMFSNPIVRENMQYLKDKGYHFIDPAEGRLACGRDGKGRLAPVGNIIKTVKKILTV